MYCPKCGEKLPDESGFCSKCGEKLTSTTVNADNWQGAENANDLAPVEPVGAQSTSFVQFKEKFGSKKFIGIAIAAVAALIVLIVLISSLSGSVGGNVYAYLSNGKYELLTNINKGLSIEIATSKSSTMDDRLLDFSPDGKYVYYYTKYDAYSGVGSLCRAEYGKLKEDGSKNDKYIEVISTKAALGFRFLSDGSITYQNGDGTLYYYNGKETVQVAKNVMDYYTSNSQNIVYKAGDYYDGYKLYCVSLGDIDNKTKLATDIGWFCNADDFDNILYVKYDDRNEGYSLYVVGLNKEAEVIAEAVEIVTSHDGRTYFLAENGTMLNLYDFVEDSYAAADARLKDPSYEERERIALREELMDEDNDFALKTLYCFENGKISTISDSVLNAQSSLFEEAIIYNTTDTVTEKKDIDDVYGTYSVRSMFEIDWEAENYIVLPGGKTCRMSVDAAEYLADTLPLLYFTDKEVYLNDLSWLYDYSSDSDASALAVAEISGGIVGDFTAIEEEEAFVIAVDDAAVYYVNGGNWLKSVSDDVYDIYADLYVYAHGSSTCLAENVLFLDTINYYKDGAILAYTDHGSSGYELTMIDRNGKTGIIADDVTQYVRVNESMLLYISDGDLYVYNGKEKSRVEKDVDRIWSRDSMEIKELNVIKDYMF